jgi:hypothetical protein
METKRSGARGPAAATMSMFPGRIEIVMMNAIRSVIGVAEIGIGTETVRGVAEIETEIGRRIGTEREIGEIRTKRGRGGRERRKRREKGPGGVRVVLSEIER